MLKVYAFVDCLSHKQLEDVGQIVSDRLFAGTPFAYEEGLRDEVPGLVLSNEVFGFTAVIYGQGNVDMSGGSPRELFRLEILPGQSLVRMQFTKWLGFGQWVAQVLADAPEIEVVRWLPDEFPPAGVYPSRDQN